jgi:hypothetical protein
MKVFTHKVSPQIEKLITSDLLISRKVNKRSFGKRSGALVFIKSAAWIFATGFWYGCVLNTP